jgi:hypothetical protein
MKATEFKGTQGEWKFECTSEVESGLDIFIHKGDQAVAWVYRSSIRTSVEQGLSNAKLIAAAPELLKALQDAVEVIRAGYDENDKAFNQAETAINKALMI